MINEERLQEILAILEEEEYSTAKFLSSALYVSTSTIYRDLRELSRRRMVVCRDGYVKRSRDNAATMPHTFRMSIHAEEKAAIAAAAFPLIGENHVLFLDSSTTAAYLVDMLPSCGKLTVVTNGFGTAIMLRNAGIRTYFTGGIVSDDSIYANGRLSREMLKQFSFDMVFFSTYAIGADGTLLDPSEEEASLCREVLSNAKTSVLLCDKSKLGKTSLFKIAHLRDIDYLVTDAPITSQQAPVKKAILRTSGEIHGIRK